MTLTSPAVRTSSMSSACHDRIPAPGSVAPRPPSLPSTAQRNRHARVAPTSWRRTYPGTRFHGKSRRAAKASMTAGFRWAPDTAPMNRMIAMTIRPGATTAALRPIAASLLASTTAAPAATSTSKNVPRASANKRRHSRLASSKSAREPNSRPYQSRTRSTSRRRASGRSDAGLCSDTALLDRLLERGVVALVLVCVGLRKSGDRCLEGMSLAEIGGDRDRVAGAGVRFCERPTAEPRILLQVGRRHGLDLRAALRIPELPYVEVTRNALGVRLADPAEEDVARGLDQPLALDDPLSVVGVCALAEVRLQDRACGLFRLHEERVVAIAAEHQHDPGSGPDATDTDDLAGSVDVTEAVHQSAAVPGKRATVVVDHALDGFTRHVRAAGRHAIFNGDDERGVAHDPRLAVDDVSQLREGLQTVLRPGLREVSLQSFRFFRRRLLGERASNLVHIDACVPEVERAHGREATDRISI